MTIGLVRLGIQAAEVALGATRAAESAEVGQALLRAATGIGVPSARLAERVEAIAQLQSHPGNNTAVMDLIKTFEPRVGTATKDLSQRLGSPATADHVQSFRDKIVDEVL